MKNARFAALIAIVLLTFAAPSKLLAQTWWEGFANAPQSNSFWQWLQQYPSVAAPLQQNPYQIYDPAWRAQHPEFQRYIQNNPGWWNSMVMNGSQYYGARFNRFLKNHPQIARDLRRNPNLIYDPNYRAQHPDLKNFLANHKDIWASIKNQRYVYSPSGGWGAYNSQSQWRNFNWWSENGDWDDNHNWHDRDWWEKNNRTWVEKNHPNWFAKQPPHIPPGQMKHEHGHGRDHGDQGRD
jgi:hypothetical protein